MVAFNKYSESSNAVVGLLLASRVKAREATETAKAVEVPFVIRRRAQSGKHGYALITKKGAT
jgi:hypothetical protein